MRSPLTSSSSDAGMSPGSARTVTSRRSQSRTPPSIRPAGVPTASMAHRGFDLHRQVDLVQVDVQQMPLDGMELELLDDRVPGPCPWPCPRPWRPCRSPARGPRCGRAPWPPSAPPGRRRWRWRPCPWRRSRPGPAPARAAGGPDRCRSLRRSCTDSLMVSMCVSSSLSPQALVRQTSALEQLVFSLEQLAHRLVGEHVPDGIRQDIGRG